MLVSVVFLRAFAWAALILPAVAAAVFFFQALLLSALNLRGSFDLPFTTEGLVLSGVGGLLLWALLSGFALVIEASVMAARHVWVTRGLLEQLRDAVEATSPETAEALAEEEAVPPDKPKVPLSFDNW